MYSGLPGLRKNKYIMTRFVLLFVFILSIINKSTSSSLILKSVYSSNTNTFICNDLKMNVEDFRWVRSEHFEIKAFPQDILPLPPLAPFTPAAAAEDSKLPNEIHNYEESLDHLRAILVKNAFSGGNNNFFIKSNLNELYKYHPHIDHVNHIYEEGYLFHKAVFSSNFNLIEILSKYANFNPNVLNKKGFSALEVACDNQNNLMIQFLIVTFESCVLQPFQAFVSIFHYAAADGRLDLLVMIKETGIFDFRSSKSAKYGISPLELALVTEQYAVVEFLIDNEAFYRPRTIKSLYLRALANFENDQNSSIFLVSYFRGLMYVKSLNSPKDFKLDIMDLAIKYNKILIVKDLLNIGFDVERLRRLAQLI